MGGVYNCFAAETIPDTTGITTLKVNIPELFPTLAKDNIESIISVGSGYFLNVNYPTISASVKKANFLTLKLSSGQHLPLSISKGKRFLALNYTDKINDSILIIE